MLVIDKNVAWYDHGAARSDSTTTALILNGYFEYRRRMTLTFISILPSLIHLKTEE